MEQTQKQQKKIETMNATRNTLTLIFTLTLFCLSHITADAGEVPAKTEKSTSTSSTTSSNETGIILSTRTRTEMVEQIIGYITKKKEGRAPLSFKKHDGSTIPNIEYYDVGIKTGNGESIMIQYFPEKAPDVAGMMSFFVNKNTGKSSVTINLKGELRGGTDPQKDITMILDTPNPVGEEHREFWMKESDRIISSVFEYFYRK